MFYETSDNSYGNFKKYISNNQQYDVDDKIYNIEVN
jgi:hypothetical protein